MLKTFTLWMEDRMKQKQLTRQLLQNLGYDTHALNGQDVVLTDRKYDNIKDAINRLDVDSENKENMITFVQNHQKEDGSIVGLSLKALAAKINANDAESQDTASSNPAVLPQGQQPAPKPFNKQQQQMQQQNQPPMAADPGAGAF